MKKKITAATIVLAALFAIVCFAIMSTPWRFVSIKASTDVSAEEFKRKMEMLDEIYETDNFSRNSEQFFSEAQERGYNEYLVPAIMCVETMGGKKVNKEEHQYNYWNLIGAYFGEEIPTITGNIKNAYLETVDTTELEIGVRILYFEKEEEAVHYMFDCLDNHYGDVTIERFAEIWTSYDSEEYATTVYEKMQEIEDL